MKTFVEIVEGKLGEIFFEFREKPHLVSYITYGVPVATAAYLQTMLSENGGAESSLDYRTKNGSLMKFTLTAVKKGDAVAFSPSFEMGDYGEKCVNKDEIEFNAFDITDMSYEIIQNTKLVNCLKNAFAGNLFNDGEWQKPEKDINDESYNGLVFDEEADIGVCTAAVIMSIIEVLCNFKDINDTVEYTVPEIGVFKITPSKSGYSVTLTIDKGFKGLCKSDRLAEMLVNKLD